MSGITAKERMRRAEVASRAERALTGPNPTHEEVRAAIEAVEEALDYARALVARRAETAPEVRAMQKQVARLNRDAFGSSVVYAVLRRDVALVKIGVTTNIKQRLSDFRRASGHPLELLLTMPGTREDEQALHARFAAYRKDGEWFAFTREVKEWALGHRYARPISRRTKEG